MKLIGNKWLLSLTAIGLVVLPAAFTFGRKDQARYFSAKAQTGTINDVVQATGTINAVTTVQVGSQVSGTISKLSADFNSHVHKGQVIAELDPSLLQGALLQAEADLQNARATLASSRADLSKAEAAAAQTKADYARNAALVKDGVVSAQQFDLAKASADTNNAGVSAAEAQVKQAAAQVSLKAAAVQVAKTNLDHSIIRSPIDGIVVARNVDVGQTVAASLQAPTLFNIAQDLTKMQVDTQTDESDVGSIKVGQEATFSVDAYPNQTFHGKVVQIRLNPTTVQNVVTYDTVIAFDNPQMKLFPGMTAYVSIPVATAQNVLELPNTALRFKPDMKPEELRALYEKSGINESGRPAASGSAGASKATSGAAAPARTPRHDVSVVWKVAADKSLQPVLIRTGITDHTNTEVAQVLKGSLQAGDELVTGTVNVSQKSGGLSGGMG
ncbi:MAG TPA: efflux RND transporter periplasmic adaptor subunit, partial [Terriglobales bacterium]|nr:efflux RND transporter periplasmic adaptor subunit [Terriglobales bacterium]